MARSRQTKKIATATPATETAALPAGSTEFTPATDPASPQSSGIIHGVAEPTRAEPESSASGVDSAQHSGNGFASQHAPQGHATGHIANPSTTRRESHADTVASRRATLPDKLTVIAGDMKVQMIDKGDNAAGIGIRVMFPEGRKPTEEEKEIIRRHIRGEEGENTGFTWKGDLGMWLKQIVRHDEHPDDVPPSRPVAIRLDAESRVQKLAEALREHSADPVGYAEMVQQRREQAAESSRIPD